MAAWKELMGFDFPSKPINVKGEELKKWPTVIIQLRGSKNVVGDEEFDINNPYSVQNKAAILDPEHPQDILIALPPSHYMEFSQRNQTYFSRLEFNSGHEKVVGP